MERKKYLRLQTDEVEEVPSEFSPILELKVHNWNLNNSRGIWICNASEMVAVVYEIQSKIEQENTGINS